MVVNCEQVWPEVSNYVEGDIDSTLKTAIDEHMRGCKRCTSVIEGIRNVVQLYGDDRMLEVPLGFGYRMRRRLDENMHSRRRSFLGWMVASAAAILIAGSFEAARSSVFGEPALRSQHSQPGSGVPPNLKVVLTASSRMFHLAGCSFIHDKRHLQTMIAKDAMRRGYVPCVRCLGQYLNEKSAHPDT